MSEKPCNICERCGKTFKYPSLLKIHLAAKKPCIESNIPVAESTIGTTKSKKEVNQAINSKLESNPESDVEVDKKGKAFYKNTDSNSDSNSEEDSENIEDTKQIDKDVKSFNEFLEAYADFIRKDIVKFINRDMARHELVKALSSVKFRFSCRTSPFNIYPEDTSVETISKIVKSIEALMKYDKMERSDEFHICQCNICKYIFLYPRNAEIEAYCIDCMLHSKLITLLEEDKMTEALEVHREYLEHLYSHRLGDILFRVGKIVNKQESLIKEDKELSDQKIKLTNEVMAIVQARNLLPSSHITVDTKTTTTSQQAANGFNWQQFQEQFQSPQFLQQAQQQRQKYKK